MEKAVELFSIKKNVVCLKCGNIGAIQSYGKYYPHGVGELDDEIKAYERVRNKPYMSHALGFGGTIPYQCMNCDNTGLIDFGGLEGYKKAFKTINFNAVK
ncbi:hypothetical protein [Virgibacillus halodenitrificans]|uniref:hypothetical protein n=1 Tax=Virgibacillus halodenitrificans TaxID=1482 RepID=UPI000EF4FF68|nr:hypothetical protein [Virgibacillus halodenitrificans]